MDFNAALETFAEAWVVANTPTAVSNPEKQKAKSTDELPTMLLREQIATGSQEVKSASPKKTDTNSTQLANAKSLPIHCVIEQINGVPSFDNTSSLTAVPDNIELDSYAILPNSTLLQDLVRAALLKLGYSSVDAINAKGAIQIKKWKPLCFDSISDNTQATIEDILGELTNVATLRIRLASTDLLLLPNEWNDHAVRRAVHILLKEMNQLTLGKLSPLCQSMISNIINNKYHNKLSQEKCLEFGEWYLNYKKQSNEFTELDKAPKDSRLTFHPVYEIPLLRNWFNTNKKPSEEKLESFCVQLNSGHVRHERPPVTTTRLKVWWKNERQKEQRILKEREEISEPVQKKSKRHRTTRLCTKGSITKDVFESNIGLQASGNAPLSSEIPASLTLCDVKDVKNDVNNDVFITPSESGPKLNTCNIDSCDTQNMLHSACNDASILHNDGNLANLEMAPSSSDFFTSGCEHHHAS